MDRTELAALLDQPDDRIDLGLAALLLARAEFPTLDPEEQMARLDALAREAAAYIDRHAGHPARIDALRTFLAETCGFRGNEED